MTEFILDTNVLIRFLVGDHPTHQQQARQWFKAAELGQCSIVVTPLVIAETCFVLESVYKHPRQSIADALEIFISQRWLRVQDRDILLQLWSDYRRGLHFVDSYLRAWVNIHGGKAMSFDKQVIKAD